MIRTEIEQVLQVAADALRNGANAAEFAALLYTPDVIVSGEGWPKAKHGLQAFLPGLAELIDAWGPDPDLTFTLVEPVLEGGSTVTTLADVYVAPRRPGAVAEYYRVMYAWVKTPRGWRVAAEMYNVGSF